MSNKPMPIPTETSRPFWDALREHRLLIQQCEACGHWIFYPRNNCPACLSADLAWREPSGRGSLYAFTLTRIPTAPEFGDEMPQKLAVVELDEGPRVNTTLTYLDERDIEVGMRVKAVFEDVEDEPVTLLRFTGESVEVPERGPRPAGETEPEPAERSPRRQIRFDDLETLSSLVGEDFTDWSNEVRVTQNLINEFAELSGDDYWIHTDPEKAKKQSPFGTTIAQGALVQVLMSRLQIPFDWEVVGYNNIVNYGSDRLRFPSPVPAGARIHARARVKSVEQVSSGTQMTLELHTHVVGQDRPSVINDLVMLYM